MSGVGARVPPSAPGGGSVGVGFRGMEEEEEDGEGNQLTSADIDNTPQTSAVIHDIRWHHQINAAS